MKNQLVLAAGMAIFGAATYAYEKYKNSKTLPTSGNMSEKTKTAKVDAHKSDMDMEDVEKAAEETGLGAVKAARVRMRKADERAAAKTANHNLHRARTKSWMDPR